jgi:hypothetical protein
MKWLTVPVLWLMLISTAYADEITELKPSGPAELRLTGPRDAYVEDIVLLAVEGLPEIDFDKPLSESMRWIDHLHFLKSAPEACVCEMTSELYVDLDTKKMTCRLKLKADSVGDVVIIGDWNEDPFGLALHRITFKRKQPPPNVKIQIIGTLNGQTPPIEAKINTSVLYEYKVANQSAVPLEDVKVTTDCILTMVGPTGDANGDELLDPDEVWTYSALAVAKLGPNPCTATAEGSVDGAIAQDVVVSLYTGTEDNPIPPIPPSGDRWVTIVYEAQDVSLGEKKLLSDIRVFNDADEDHEHTVAILDKDYNAEWFKGYMQLITDKGAKLPAIVIVDPEHKQVLFVGELPKDLNDYKELMKQNGG